MHDREQRTELGRMAARAHDIQISDAALRAELAACTAGDADRDQARTPGEDFEDEPLIGVLSSHTSGPAAQVQTGQALQRVLLTATADGLAVSLLSQLVEVPEIREQMRRLISGDRRSQVVLRIGYGWPVTATPRRAEPSR